MSQEASSGATRRSWERFQLYAMFNWLDQPFASFHLPTLNLKCGLKINLVSYLRNLCSITSRGVSFVVMPSILFIHVSFCLVSHGLQPVHGRSWRRPESTRTATHSESTSWKGSTGYSSIGTTGIHHTQSAVRSALWSHSQTGFVLLGTVLQLK